MIQKPSSPSRMPWPPRKPSAADSAPKTPPSAIQPHPSFASRIGRVSSTTPKYLYADGTGAYVPAIPMAASIATASSPSSRPAATHGANGVYCWPQTRAPRSAVGCIDNPIRVPIS